MWFEPQTKTIVYQTNEPLKIAAVCPDARQLPNGMVAVPFRLTNLQHLRRQGFPVVEPMAMYDWPGRFKPFQAQRVTSNFLTLNPKAFVLSDMGCVDADTEYLSPTGWRKMGQYDGGQVAQYHADGRIEFVQPSEYVRKPCAEMYRFKTARGVDQKLSPEHRVLYVDGGNNLRVTSAAAVAENQTRNRQGWRGRFITTFSGGGVGLAFTDELIRVQVAVAADGHFPNKSNRCIVRLKKARKKERLRQILAAAQIPWDEKDERYKNCEGFTKFSFIAPSRDKEFAPHWWHASHEQLRVIAAEVAHWDGSLRKAGAVSFFSKSKASADFIQYAFCATGRTASIAKDKRDGGVWDVHARAGAALVGLNGNDAEGNKTNPIALEPTTDGWKYCFAVPTSFLVFRRNGCVFVSGNTGKSLAALWAADFLMRLYPKGTFRAVIVSPLSTLRRVWVDEINQHFLGRRSCVVVHGSAEQREKLLRQDVDFYIINHDGLSVGATVQTKDPWRSVAASLRDRTDIKLAIVDEASAYRDASTRRHKIARHIYATKDYLWLMTGTPTPNAPTDAYGLAKLVNGAQGHSFLSFQSLTMNKISNFKWIPRHGAQDEVRKLLSPAVRFAIEDCVDLPECTVQRREAELSQEQRQLLKQIKDNFQIQVGQGTISAVNQGVLRMKLIQIACGAVYDNDREVRLVDATARIKVLEEVLEEAPGKVIVFAPLTSVLHMLHHKLPSKWTRAIVNGEVSQAKRSEIFQKFQNEPDPKVLIADPGTMAHGLTLTAGRTIVWYAPTDKTEVYLQANKRIHRPGQKFTTAVVQLSSTATEREIYRRLEANESMQGAILKLAEER